MSVVLVLAPVVVLVLEVSVLVLEVSVSASLSKIVSPERLLFLSQKKVTFSSTVNVGVGQGERSGGRIQRVLGGNVRLEPTKSRERLTRTSGVAGNQALGPTQSRESDTRTSPSQGARL